LLVVQLLSTIDSARGGTLVCFHSQRRLDYFATTGQEKGRQQQQRLQRFKSLFGGTMKTRPTVVRGPSTWTVVERQMRRQTMFMAATSAASEDLNSNVDPSSDNSAPTELYDIRRDEDDAIPITPEAWPLDGSFALQRSSAVADQKKARRPKDPVATAPNWSETTTTASATPSTTPLRSSGTIDSASGSIRHNLGPLLQLTRPANFPGVVIFHMTGVYLALKSLSPTFGSMATTSATLPTYYWTILLKRPAMWLTLVAILLVDSSSMVVNDYYDAKLGRDVGDKRALVAGRLSFQTTKLFVSYLYAAALAMVSFLPGAATRFAVIAGLMVTYLYTQHMKRVTWVKNLVCASLIALSPWTSGVAALHVALASDRITLAQLFVPPLFRLTVSLFSGFMAREILMDCNDLENDQRAEVWTVPVVHGRRFAGRVAFGGTLAMTALALVGPLLQLASLSTGAAAAVRKTALRRLAFGVPGCSLSLYRAWRVVQTEANDKAVLDSAIDEGRLTVLFLLATFL
jgi:4-hydroxybenzoate polyprenyltransferase